jgi:asparagine synthase (glutamine-hydrolysing)
MCGIAGLWVAGGAPESSLTQRARAMAQAIRHRGPDGEGFWHDPEAGVALAHRRLAIIDLSPGGAQPMHDCSGRFVITYNGELYNYRELAAELAALGHAPRGASDTAVLLEAIACWGIEAALPRLNGMFAFALWDRAERLLFLARDHAGIKPLYYRATQGEVLFGSELPALVAAGGWAPELDPASASLLLRDACIPAPHAIFQGVRKLLPGALVRFDAPGAPRPTRWYDLGAVVRATPAFRGSAADVEAELDALLQQAARLQTVADVPVGAFLSGGIDSASVVAAIAPDVQTFTIGFDDPAYDESLHAAAIARHLGVRHTRLTATAADALALATALPAIGGEPFADSSLLPTLLLSRLTRAHVTVALSGDGGDELFGGYRRHALAAGLWRHAARVPRPLRALAGGAVAAVPEAWLDRGLKFLKVTRPGETLHKTAGILGAADIDAVHARLTAQWPDAARVKPPAPETAIAENIDDPLTRMRLLDAAGYMQDDVLTKVDRASMAVALEARVPLLDPRIIRFAFSLPGSILFEDGRGKAPLRRVLARRVPRALMDRPKMGFSAPIGAWLRHGLRDWAEALLAAPRLAASGLYDVGVVREAWAQHLSGRRSHHHALWCVLMLEAWREQAVMRACTAAA